MTLNRGRRFLPGGKPGCALPLRLRQAVVLRSKAGCGKNLRALTGLGSIIIMPRRTRDTIGTAKTKMLRHTRPDFRQQVCAIACYYKLFFFFFKFFQQILDTDCPVRRTAQRVIFTQIKTAL